LIRELDHVGIAVRSLERSLHLYERGFGIKAAYIREVADQKTRVASLPLGSMRIELLEASAEDSPIARFITRRGEGIHHLCFLVDDILAELKRFKSEGMRRNPTIWRGWLSHRFHSSIQHRRSFD
jgi:methylmalonyl-CoA/ethylmalonyl-CoA epimerase